MGEFKVIVVMNKAMIEVLKEKNENFEINLKIEQDLKDEAYFFKIQKIDAFEILQKVGVKQEQLENVYKKLISPNVYYNLIQKGKINENDENLVIKYKTKRL